MADDYTITGDVTKTVQVVFSQYELQLLVASISIRNAGSKYKKPIPEELTAHIEEDTLKQLLTFKSLCDVDPGQHRTARPPKHKEGTARRGAINPSVRLEVNYQLLKLLLKELIFVDFGTGYLRLVSEDMWNLTVFVKVRRTLFVTLQKSILRWLDEEIENTKEVLPSEYVAVRKKFVDYIKKELPKEDEEEIAKEYKSFFDDPRFALVSQLVVSEDEYTTVLSPLIQRSIHIKLLLVEYQELFRLASLSADFGKKNYIFQ